MTNIAGLFLIALGVSGLVWGGISFTTTETAVDLAPTEATRDQTRTLPVPPFAGALALAGGAVLLASVRE